MVGWNGLFAPKGTPPEIQARLNGDLAKILATPEMKAQLTTLGAEPGGRSQATFAAFVKGESDRWGRIIREKGIKPE
jgi:tripartite-type tricarboxylate transporter receptor subunit TctC